MTVRYAHLSPEHLREAVNRATLGKIGDGTVTKTVTNRKPVEEGNSQLLEKLEAAGGIEPPNRSFADCSLSHLGTPPFPFLIP